MKSAGVSPSGGSFCPPGGLLICVWCSGKVLTYTAIMLGSALDMSFLDFFIYDGKPGMFFAVEPGALLSALILAIIPAYIYLWIFFGA